MATLDAVLALEDGKIFRGVSFGARGERYGEVVFNTAMSGYQEILTDPSYKGQMVVMTYPLIGNYGVNKDDVESCKPFLEGFIVKEYSKIPSSWRSQQSLGDYMKEYGIVGIEGIDTRALTLHIRQAGELKAVLSTEDLNEKNLIKKARESSGLIGRDLVRDVACRNIYEWNKQGKYKVVVMDCGVKLNILRSLSKNNCRVIVVPPTTNAAQILSLKPDGFMLSNGPGDPAALLNIIHTTKALLGKLPIFGICLGHQVLGWALGGKTYKLKFGHHGGNHPVKDIKTGKVAITVQNHGFCVNIDSLDKRDIEATHVNLNDNTLEGMRHKRLPVFSVQFHPESSPGPHDAGYLFEKFVKLMECKTCQKEKTSKRS